MKLLTKWNISRFFPSDWVVVKWIIMAEVLLLVGIVACLLGVAL